MNDQQNDRQNMCRATLDARGVMAILIRRPLFLESASLGEVRVAHRALSTLVGTMDAYLEQASSEPTDMAAQVTQEPVEITGHHYPICVCLRCGPPWRETAPRTQAPAIDNLTSSWMALCPRCGNKRCAGAVDHDRPCTVNG